MNTNQHGYESEGKEARRGCARKRCGLVMRVRWEVCSWVPTIVVAAARPPRRPGFALLKLIVMLGLVGLLLLLQTPWITGKSPMQLWSHPAGLSATTDFPRCLFGKLANELGTPRA